MQTFEVFPFLRGTSTRYPIDRPYVGIPRRNRRPRDLSEPIHHAADDWFFRRFSCRFRSQALFVSPQLLVAAGYGATPDHVVRILPLGAYQYCWSRKTSDLLSVLKQVTNIEDVEQELVGADYTNSDLRGAHESGHELMLFCDRYVAIPVSQLVEDNAAPQPNKSIILTSS